MYGREGKLANCDVTNTYDSFPLQARPFLVRSREALGNSLENFLLDRFF